MPLTDLQKEYIVKQSGLDPSSYTTDEGGDNIIPLTQVNRAQPSISQKVSPPVSTPVPTADSALTTGFKSFAQEAPSAIGAGAGLGIGGALSTSLLGALDIAQPEIGIPLHLALALTGAAIGGGAAKEVQSTIEPESWQENVAQSQATNPKAAIAGQLATLPLGGFNPSPSNLVRAGGTLGRLVTGMSPEVNELQNLLNVGMGAGLGPAQEVGSSVISGTPMPGALDLLKSTGIGALFNRPNSLGKLYGLHEAQPIQSEPSGEQLTNLPRADVITNPQTQTTDTAIMAQQVAQDIARQRAYGISQPADQPTGAQPGSIKVDETTGQRTLTWKNKTYPLTPEGLNALYTASGGASGTALASNKRVLHAPEPTEPSEKELGDIEGEGGIVPKEDDEEVVTQQPTKIVEPVIEQPTNKYKVGDTVVNRQGDKGTVQDIVPPSGLNKALYKVKFDNGITKNFDPKWLKEYVPTQREVDYQKALAEKVSQQHADTEVPVLPAKPLNENAMRILNKDTLVGSDITRPERRNQEGSGLPQTALEKQTVGEVNKNNLPTTPEAGWWQYFKSLGQKRNVELGTDGTLVNSTTGKAIAGTSWLRQGINKTLALINPRAAGPETAGHEIFHPFLNDLLNSPRTARDKAIAQRGLDIVSKSPDYQKWAEARRAANVNDSPEEYLTTDVGYGLIRRALNVDNESPLKKWLGDTQAYLKTRWSKHATEADYKRILTYKLYHDPAFSKVFGDGEGGLEAPVSNVAQASDNQDESSLNRYKEVQSRMKELVNSGKLDSDEFQSLFKEMETIKNTNKGMPPEEKSNSEKSHLIGNYHDGVVNALKDRSPSLYGEADSDENFMSHAQHGLSDHNRWRYNSKDNSLEWTDKPDNAANDAVLSYLKKRGITPDKNFNWTNLYSESSSLPNFHSHLDELLDNKHEHAPLGYSSFPLTRPQLEQAKRTIPEGNDDVINALQNWFKDKDEIYGKGMAPILQAAKGLNKGDITKVHKILVMESRDKQDYSKQYLNKKQLALHDAVRESLLQKQKDQIADKQPVTDYKSNGDSYQREAQIDPYYFPNKLSPKIAEILTEHPDRAGKEKQDFINHNVEQGVSPEAAETKWNTILKAYDKGSSNQTRFNADREAQGVGLPDSMMKDDLIGNMSNYFNRVSADRAWYKNIENKPDVAGKLGIEKDAWGKDVEAIGSPLNGNKHIKEILEGIHGEGFDKSERLLKGLMKVATAGMLGPMTNTHIAGSSLFNSMQYGNPAENFTAATHALAHMGQSLEHAMENGYYRKDLSSVKDIWNVNNTGLEKLSSLGSFIGNLSGRDFVNKWTKSYLQGFGESLIGMKNIAANNGDKTSIQLMKKLDPEWKSGIKYTPDALNKLASQWAGLVHGAHDARTLPGWMLKDNAIQPFFSLASWNIAQTNAWMRHVWTPAKSGNFTPLIMSTLGSLVGGYVIKELREKMADKKSAIPSLNEIVNSDRGWENNIPNLAYNAMAMQSYVGYAGILSTVAKAAFDVAHKNIPQGAAFPLDEVMSNSAHRITQFTSALLNDPNMDYFESSKKLVMDLTKENFQLGRLATAWATNFGFPGTEQNKIAKDLSAKTQDLRRWEMVEGKPFAEQTPSEDNPYIGGKTREFKRTSDMNEAAQALPDLIGAAIKKADGNIDVLKSEFKKIKQNNYQTMPNPDEYPRSFYSYLNFVTKTQGADKANSLVQDYMMKRAMNQAKSSMIPSL